MLVVSGFLGAGKTTLVNRLLVQAEGRRIAAIVNDFGAINIDAELVAERSDNVIGLRNGCICCSLQGDLLRTLKLVIRRAQMPDQIVIEASGVADPEGIIAALQDPVLWGSVMLDAVLTVVDAEDCTAHPARMDDPVWCAQVDSADLLMVTKTGDLDTTSLHAFLSKASRAPILSGDDAQLPVDLILAFKAGDRVRRPRRIESADRFVTLELETDRPACLGAFQQAMEALRPSLLRAKGLLTFAEMSGKPQLFQMTGSRATLAPFGGEVTGCQLVLIGERGRFDPESARKALGGAMPGTVIAARPQP